MKAAEGHEHAAVMTGQAAKLIGEGSRNFCWWRWHKSGLLCL